jgi:hypothetical protein
MEIAVLAGPVTVAFCKVDREWTCTALEFDIVGIGSTRDEAFDEMRGLVHSYLVDVIQEPGPVELLNPSDPAEYRRCEKQEFKVAVALAKLRGSRTRVRRELPDIRTLRRLRNRIKGVDLIPMSR